MKNRQGEILMKNNQEKFLILGIVFIITMILIALNFFQPFSLKLDPSPSTDDTPHHVSSSERDLDRADRSKSKLKLYWFIPDGLRADPTVFQIYKWAQNGELPNIRKMMEQGVYGYSRPVFPSHTPTNYASLLTGTTPKVHGVADGPMRLSGYPLKMVSLSGFNSVAKHVPPIWLALENNNFLVTLLSIPGSTPPELHRGNTIRGRWGGWGIDFPAIIFNTIADQSLRIKQGPGNRLFNFGSELTKFIVAVKPADWAMQLPFSFSSPIEIELRNWGNVIYGFIYDSTNDDYINYDRILFSQEKTSKLTDLKEGEWSDWLDIDLFWETKNDYNTNTPKRMQWERDLSVISVATQLKIRLVSLDTRGLFRIRFVYNNLNQYLVKPSQWAKDIIKTNGPAVDFVDNFPPQLIYYPQDKSVFMEEARMSMDWHKRMAKYVINKMGSEAVIHGIYTPNQMLTSRWWMGYLDPKSPRYDQISDQKRAQLWEEVKDMYRGIDGIIGEVLQNSSPNTLIALSSDHGAVPLHKEVRLNNLFTRKGLLRFSMNKNTGEYQIDWKNTRVIYLKMDNIYINPNGLDGIYKRAKGKRYEKLRNKVIRILTNLKDENGVKPVVSITKWEDAQNLNLPRDRVGDLIIANRATYGWMEDLSADLMVFKKSTKTGYKQALLPEEEGLLTPFILMGPGVKKNYKLSQIVQHIDQYPTIMKIMGQVSPSHVEGGIINEIFY